MQGLKQRHEKRGLTQANVVQAVGVQQSAVSMWEHDNAFPRKATLDKLCKFFNCKADDLL